MVIKLLALSSKPLVVVHLAILYFWIFDWEKLMTKVGLISWGGSILLGVIIYLLYRKLVITEKRIVVSKIIVLATTLMTVLLGVFTLIIEFITRSMP
ncbi:hypothetical protein D1B31_14260 [Neobacillus notoginsengisoli]|uniref:Uncharacterized protein n=1 Tax=Neobacillus notoginsengisoli TaxID=1578198 RepID=A0A417YSX9_9BACI|nr:hypothetical protein [Neobacillus notoginsengisoli]RHW39115.1 hypothetical protein D1B31_14260 [Neobacillus notoginsengisoli]